MKKRNKSSMTRAAMQALTNAVAKAVDDHRRRGIPLAVWRDGRAVSIPASEAGVLRETPSESKAKGFLFRGKAKEIMSEFDGPDQLRNAVNHM